jgi:hypothetical protein
MMIVSLSGLDNHLAHSVKLSHVDASGTLTTSDTSKPVARRGRKAMDPAGAGQPGCRR